MKRKKLIAGIALLLSVLFSQKALAQADPSCEWNVHNGLSCTIVVNITWYKNNGTCIFCSSTNYTIPANSMEPISCGTCTDPCDVEITIITAGGVTVNVSANKSTFPTRLPATGDPSCGNGGDFYLTWNSGNADISY